MDVSTVIDAAVTFFSVTGVGAYAAALLPKPSANAVKVYKLVRLVVDFVGANWVNAKNETAQSKWQE